MTLTLHADPVPLRVDEEGTVRVGDTRVTLATVIQRFRKGDSPETLAQSFAPVLLADIYAVIGYYLHHRAEVDAYLLHQDREADAFRERHAQFFPEPPPFVNALESRHEKESHGRCSACSWMRTLSCPLRVAIDGLLLLVQASLPGEWEGQILSIP